MSKMAGNLAALTALVGLAAFFASVFSFVPRMFLVIGIALIVVSLIAFFVEEAAERRFQLSRSQNG